MKSLKALLGVASSGSVFVAVAAVLVVHSPDVRGESASAAQVIDMNAPAPAWRDVNAMREVRYMHNPVMLADGKAMILGGSDTADQTTHIRAAMNEAACVGNVIYAGV